jgi:tetratricopeptide (TPR) repeat protein
VNPARTLPSTARLSRGDFLIQGDAPSARPAARNPRPLGPRGFWLAVALVVSGTAVLAEDTRPPLKEAASLRAAGRFDEALDVLRIESREIKKADGDESLRLLPVNDLAAEILIDQGTVEAAEPLLRKTIATRQRLVDAGTREHAAGLGRSLMTLTRLETVARRFPEAVVSAQQALVVCDRAEGPGSEATELARKATEAALDSLETFLGPADEATLKARDGVATTFASLGMFTAAIEQRRRILDGLSSSAGPGTPDRLAAVERLCRLMMLGGRAAEAIPVVEKALAAITPPNAPAALAMTRLLGELQSADDRLIAANVTFKSLLETTRAAAGPASYGSAADRLHLLLIAERREQADGLPDWFAQDLKVLARPPPAEAAAAIAGLVVAGDVLMTQEKPGAAIEPLSQALAVAGSLKPPSAEHVADLSGRVAEAQIAAGNAAAAQKMAEPALTAAKVALGPGDARVSFLRLMLADALRNEKDSSQVEALIEETLNRDLPRPDDSWERTATLVVDRLADTEWGKDLRERYVAARARQFGDEHPFVGMAWSLFGTSRLAAGDWAAAANCFSRAFDVQQANLGPDHPEVAATLTLLAHAERAAGEPTQAAVTAARAVAAWERAAGPDHPGTLAAADIVVSARIQSGDLPGVEELLERLCKAEAGADPVRRAGHLVRLAGLVAPRDKNRALEHLQAAMTLPCWTPDATARDSERLQLAYSAARAAWAYQMIGQPTRSEEALRKARSLTLQMSDHQKVLDRIESLATGHDGAVDP